MNDEQTLNEGADKRPPLINAGNALEQRVAGAPGLLCAT